MISRRRFIARMVTLPALPQAIAGSFRLKLAKEWSHALFGDVSADGRKMFLNLAHGLFLPYSWKVVEVGTWADIYTFRRNDWAQSVTFFDDFERIYIQTNGVGQDLLVDLKLRQHHVVRERSRGSASYQALSGQNLLGIQLTQLPNDWALIKAELPDYRELLRIPAEGIAMLSADRKWCLGVDHGKGVIIYRRTIDLSTVWAAQIKTAAMHISADGSVVALSTPVTFASQGDVRLLDGRNGRIIAVVPLDHVRNIAISPSQRLLATARSSAPDKPYLLTVSIHELPSGRHLATEVHDSGPVKFLDQGLGRMEFTADSRYLFTAGRILRVWRLENAPA